MASTAPLDEDLVRSALQGEMDSFAELVRRHKGRILALCSRFGRTHSDIDDLAQEVFIRAWQKLSQFRQDAPFEHWLTRIATHACYDALRKAKPEPVPLDDLPVRDPRDPASAAEAREVLDWALSQLRAEERLVITLLEIEERTVREIAELTGWSESNVKVRAFRAREELKRQLAFVRQQEGA